MKKTLSNDRVTFLDGDLYGIRTRECRRERAVC